MAEPMTYKAARERFELPVHSAVIAPKAVEPLTPDELINLVVENEQRQLAEQASKAIQPKPHYNPESDAAVLDLVGPQQPPAMEKPPSLHTREELDAEPVYSRFEQIGSEPIQPTISRTPEPRGAPPFAPDTGQGGGGLHKLLRGIFTGLDIFEGAARGAAAGEGAGSFLGGAGRASETIRQRGLQEQAHAANQRAAAARAGRIEAETAALPAQVDLERQTQEILNFQRDQAAQYTAMLTKQIAERLKQAPERMRLDNLRIISDLAANKARELTQRRLLGQGKTQEEIDLIMARVETEREHQNYLRSGAGLREAQEARQWAEAGDVGRTDRDRIRPLSPVQIRKDIVSIQNQLRERHMNPITRKVDEVALANDPDLQVLQDLEELYQDSLSRYREGVGAGAPSPSPSSRPSPPGGVPRGSASPFGLPSRPPADFEALVNQRFPPPR